MKRMKDETKYYLVGLKKDGKIRPVGNMTGEDKIPDPLFTTEDGVKKYCKLIQKAYPEEEYCCLKAIELKE